MIYIVANHCVTENEMHSTETVFIREPRHSINSDFLPLFVKYFILLAITAVLSLESKYENIVVSSQSFTTARQERKSRNEINIYSE